MRAVTNTVEAALRAPCHAWQLLLDKLSLERGGDATAKTGALRQVRQAYNSDRTRAHLVAACYSRSRLLEALAVQHRGRFGVVELFQESRLMLHLGRANVLENVGLFAERTTGLPIIPGTALKGLISTWACWESNQRQDGSFNEAAGFEDPRADYLDPLAARILGDDSADGSEHGGSVVFVGAFPTTPPQLGLDIVNPHHGPTGQEMTNLTPNVFLCLEPGTKWRFAFYVRQGSTDAAVPLINTTIRWISEALTQVGIGAKTAAGYGRFRVPTRSDVEDEEKKAKEAQEAAAVVVQEAKLAQEKKQTQALAQAALAGDYPNDVIFNNTVIAKLNPGQLDQLKEVVVVLQKPENASWRDKLKDSLSSREYKDISKRLKQKPWFPRDWLQP